MISTLIKFKEEGGKHQTVVFSSQKSNDTFLVSLQPATRGTMSVTFPRNGYSTEEQKFLSLKFLLLLFFFLIYWIAVEAILLLVSAMIKPFELIKVSFFYTVPNARNTRRSTALGETPSYLVLCQIPRTVQSRCGFSLCWVWLWHAERKCASLLYAVSLFCTVRCEHSSKAVSSSLQSFPNSIQGYWQPGGNPNYEKGAAGGRGE